MARRTSLKRKQVVAAVHKGMAKAARRFQRWTGGEALADWGVESLLTAYCAEEVAAAAGREGARFRIFVEQPFGGLLAWSERKHGVGRPHRRAVDMVERPTRRVDLVIRNAMGAPRAVIELKRDANLRGLEHDAKRLADFVQFAGRDHNGSIRWGILGVLVHARGSHASGALDRMLALRDEKLTDLAEGRGLGVKVTIKTLRQSSGDPRLGALATMVFEFFPKRG